MARGLGVGKSTGRLLQTHGPSLGVLLAGVLLWEAGVRALQVPAFVLPRPSAVAGMLVSRHDLFLRHALPTTQEILLGFLASTLVGIPVAIGIVYSRVFERVSYTVIVAFQTIPKTALAPLFVLWFGFGLLSKVAVAFLIAFFPIVVNTVIGMRSVEPETIYLAQSLGATPLQVFLKVRLPRALPSIFGGLKVAITLAVVGAIVGEYIAANEGLGYIQLQANSNLDTVMLFATIAVLSALGIVLFYAVGVLERLVVRWRPGEEQLEAARETL
ncbi:MAG: ABC transporter permease [Armatimonadota bacterium]|nr:ABC transporter permease [Armatimonadota bacterium]MDR7448278.1 ABC transporter permease [Armatimonadota bacterium]MDR7458308.1 ABC transporter permease [Armatimonadota bacterium]MDR7478389.1 ABC transporter permease [Armatimonadota bacterium]MDR7487323.1 ABC transporter permease [Armatimonadota bacterium]